MRHDRKDIFRSAPNSRSLLTSRSLYKSRPVQKEQELPDPLLALIDLLVDLAIAELPVETSIESGGEA